MSMKIFLLHISRMLILLITCIVKSRAQGNNPTSGISCPPSSCGTIRNISFPFRLKTDPPSCGYNYPSFELDCQNNQTVMNVESSKYHVQEINYGEFWVRLVDPSINKENLSSCPVYSDHIGLGPLNTVTEYTSSYVEADFNMPVPVVFIHCFAPVRSLDYVESFCGSFSSSSVFSNSSRIYIYIIARNISVSDLEETCAVDRVIWASGRRPVKDTSSLASIYDSLAYGLEISWLTIYCDGCDGMCIVEATNVRCLRNCNLKCQLLFGQYRQHLGVVRRWAYILGDHCESRFNLRLGIKTCFLYIALFLAGRCLVCGFPCLVGVIAYRYRRRHLSMDETIEEFLQGQNNITPIKYSYSEIKKMTNNFDTRLGEGAYGTVYKGKLRSGSYAAIKIMGQSISSEQEFISEVRTIGHIHHVNIVQLIGFCVERSRCALVYEFLSNGSLDKYIFSQEGIDGLTLSYKKMYDVALGVARGIDYLHRGCSMQILHFDIKPHNILLDENFNPKISDFGLSKLYPVDGSIVHLTTARGTIGYMAPEMFYNNIGGVSYRADVYSYGMLLLEIAGRRKNLNPFADDVSQIYFPSWAYDHFVAAKEMEIEDAIEEEEREIVKKIILVALWCIQMKPSDRPPMNQVLEMLESDSDLQVPPKPFVAPWEMAKHH